VEALKWYTVRNGKLTIAGDNAVAYKADITKQLQMQKQTETYSSH